MKKIKFLFLIFYIILAFFTSACSSSKNNTTTHSDANIIDMQDNLSTVQSKSDYIVIGKVKKNYSYKLYNVIFTNYVLDINRKIKTLNNNLPNEIEIRFTGGQVNSENQPILENVKTLETNQIFLLFLKKVFPDNPANNYYTVLGGEHQGIFKVEVDKNNNILKTYKFNDKNKFEKDLMNKNVENLLKTN